MVDQLDVLYIGPLILGTLATLLAIMAVCRHWREPRVLLFLVLVAALAGWMSSTVLRILASTLQAKIFWDNIGWSFIPLALTTVVLFTIHKVHRSLRLSIPLLSALALEPVIVSILVWTNHRHSFMWIRQGLETDSPFTYLDAIWGPGFYLHALYAYCLSLVGIIIFIKQIYQSPTLRTNQIVLLSLMVLTPLLVNFLFLTDRNFYAPLDPTPIFLTVLALSVYALDIFDLNLWDVWPLAQSVVLEHMNDGVIVLDLENNIIRVNNAAQRFLGIHENQMNGQSLDMILADLSCLPEIHAALASIRRDGAAEHVDGMLETSTGRIRYLHITITGLFNRRQRLTGRLLVIRDVTRSTLAQQALREREEQYRTLIEISPDAIVVTSLNMVILFCNQKAAELYGINDPHHLINRQATEFLVPDEVGRFMENTSETLMTGRAEGRIYHLQRIDGEVVPLELNASVVKDEFGSPQGFVAILRDISERQRVEEAIRQSQKLEGIGLLAGGVAHDFNNLLTSILTQNGLAQRKLNDNEPVKQHLAKAMQSAEHAAELTRQLLAYAGKGQFQLQAIDLNEAVRNNAALLETAVPKKISLRLKLQPDLPAIRADRGQLQQVVMNLVLNAAEAIDGVAGQAGIIEVETATRMLTQEDVNAFLGIERFTPGKHVELRVSDTGVGMDAKTMTRIFDPFFTTKPQGRGLGLSALLGIIRAHHGGLQVTSEVGRGSTFRAVFPAIEARPTMTDKPAKTLQNLTGTVLVIDDEDPVRDALTEYLTYSGLRVLTASDGKKGIDCFRAYHEEVDLVLLDMQMPVMGGPEAFRALRTIKPTTRIILSSGYSESTIDAINPDSHTAFLQKPYELDTLMDKVAEMLEG